MSYPLSQDWPFEEPKNVAVFTTEKVLLGSHPILYVSHDYSDGAWQFHDGIDVNYDEAKITALSNIVKRDPSLLELADLPLGWIAVRESKNDSWHRSKLD
jgi:hypothetical protein